MRSKLYSCCLTGLLLASALVPARAAAEVLIITQAKVKEYGLVVEGIRSSLSGAKEVDVEDTEALNAALASSPSVIIAVGSKAFGSAKILRSSGASIIAAAVVAPDGAGQGDIAAVPLEPRATETLEALQQIKPDAKKILALYAATNIGALNDAKQAAAQLNLSVDFKPVADLDGFADMFRAALVGREVVWLLMDPRLGSAVKFMINLCLEQRIVLIGFVDGMTRQGAVVSHAPDMKVIGRESGRLALDLSKSKAGKPPVRFVPGKITVNKKTFESLGLKGKIPAGAEVF